MKRLMFFAVAVINLSLALAVSVLAMVTFRKYPVVSARLARFHL